MVRVRARVKVRVPVVLVDLCAGGDPSNRGSEDILSVRGGAGCDGGARTEGRERFYAAEVAGVVQASAARDPRHLGKGSKALLGSRRSSQGSAGFEPQRRL